jgi:thioredoxin reductase
LNSADRRLLSDNHIAIREEAITEVVSSGDGSVEIRFQSRAPIGCDAIFFGAGQHQHSHLPKLLGCEIDDDGLIRRDDKQRTCVDGVFIAGDAASDVQFAIVAAAQGAAAAAAINRMLQEDEIIRVQNETERIL